MNFTELANKRQSCRKFNPEKHVDDSTILEILEIANLSPSACNGQPYKITVAKGNKAKEISKETTGMGMNKFTAEAPIMIVISEDEYVKTAALGAKLKGNDYRSMDIGIYSAFLTLKAAEMGIGTCILGWFDDKKIRSLCGLNTPVRMVIAMGYPVDGDPIRSKKRKSINDIVSFCE